MPVTDEIIIFSRRGVIIKCMDLNSMDILRVFARVVSMSLETK